MADEEQPQEQPQEEEQQAEEASPAPAEVTVDDVKGLEPSAAWEKYPDLHAKYEALEDKEGIVTEEGAWGDKADEFLGANADAFAPKPAEEEGAPPEEPAAPPPPEKIVKTVTAEEIAALGEANGWTAKWKAYEDVAGKENLGKLVKAAFNGMLECAVPVDVMSLGKTNKDLYTRFGKPRMQKEHMRWNKLKAVYAWEKSMGGPLWNFPEGETTSLDGPAHDVVKTKFVEQSKEGLRELTFGTKIASNSRVEKDTYEAIVKRALGNRLEANGLSKYEIELSEYKTDEDCTFTVTHKVLDGTDEEVLKRAKKAIQRQVDIKALVAELKKAKNLVAEASLNSQDIESRTADLKEMEPELDIDAAAPILSLREATKESQEKIRQAVTQLEEKASDAVFAEKVADGQGEGKQVDYRVNLAKRLRVWLEAQQKDISAKVDAVNAKLLDKSMNAAEDEELSCTTEPLKVDGAETAEAPEFLKADRANAVDLLDMVFSAAIKATLGDSATSQPEAGEGSAEVSWKVTLSMDV